MRRLNRWQKLWIIFSAIYLLVLGIVTNLVFMPNEEPIMRAWSFDLIDVVKAHDPSLRNKVPGEIMSLYSDLSYDEIISRVQKKYSTPKMIVEYTVINKKYEEKLDNFGKEQIKVMSLAFLWWLAHIIVFYVFGIIMGWIYREGWKQT